MLKPSTRHGGRSAFAALAWLAAGLLITATGLRGRPAAAEDGAGDRRPPRPADLVILERSSSVNGEKQIGIYSARPDPRPGGLWSVQVWEESRDRVTIATDRIGCSPSAPLRITGAGGQLLVRELNPGGPIHPGNRVDHLIWWAVCFPKLAGRDPATLAATARQLGYSGQLQEQQQVLRAPRN